MIPKTNPTSAAAPAPQPRVRFSIGQLPLTKSSIAALEDIDVEHEVDENAVDDDDDSDDSDELNGAMDADFDETSGGALTVVMLPSARLSSAVRRHHEAIQVDAPRSELGCATGCSTGHCTQG